MDTIPFPQLPPWYGTFCCRAAPVHIVNKIAEEKKIVQKAFLKHDCTLWWMIEFFSTHMWFKYGSWGWRANHQPICGHRTLSFSCGRNTTKPEAGKERRACYPWGPRSYQSLCHNDSPCNWSVDAESTGQLWQSALCVCVCVFASCGFVCVCICILSLDAAAAECRNMHVGGAHVVIRC